MLIECRASDPRLDTGTATALAPARAHAPHRLHGAGNTRRSAREIILESIRGSPTRIAAEADRSGTPDAGRDGVRPRRRGQRPDRTAAEPDPRQHDEVLAADASLRRAEEPAGLEPGSRADRRSEHHAATRRPCPRRR